MEPVTAVRGDAAALKSTQATLGLRDDCGACASACPGCTLPAAAFPCCPLPFAPPTTASACLPPVPPFQPFASTSTALLPADCSACAEEPSAPSKSHLAWCCDDADCLSPRSGQPGSSLPSTSTYEPEWAAQLGDYDEGVPWDQMMLLDDCAACARAPPAPSDTPFSLDPCCTSGSATPTLPSWATSAVSCADPGCYSPPQGEPPDDCPTCVGGLGLITTDGEAVHAQPQPTMALHGEQPAGLLGAAIPPNECAESVTEDAIEGLLHGLDEKTIQDILNCCCCDSNLHDQGPGFDPSTHAEHHDLPQHIHCADAHHSAPPVATLSGANVPPLPALPVPPHQRQQSLDPSFFLQYAQLLPQLSHLTAWPAGSHPSAAQVPPTSLTLGASSSPAPTPSVHRCEWRSCSSSFGTRETLIAHVLAAHLVPIAPAPSSTSTKEPHLPISSRVFPPQTHPQQFLAALAGLHGGAPAAAAAAPYCPHTHVHSHPHPPSHPHAHSHAHSHAHAHAHSDPHAHSHRHPYDAAHAAATATKQRGRAPPRASTSASASASRSATPPSSSSAAGGHGLVPLLPAATTPPSPAAAAPAPVQHACHWRGCASYFGTTAELMEHLSTAHVGAGKARYTCEWVGCERSTECVCGAEGEGEGEWERRREAREDKGVFRQRQKVMRHLQMHTGDRPYACELCGKTFSEALTLTQHMRVHTQERPYVCDEPGCGKAFALASALTIHKRTHTGLRPFICPHPGCTAAFSESSNLSKHIRTHGAERRYVCPEAGCGKAFGRSDQLKRHGRVHVRRRRGAAAVGEEDGEEEGEEADE